MSARQAVLFAATGAVAIAACHSSEVAVGSVETTGATSVTQRKAADEIAKAQCAHARECGQLTETHRYRTYEECDSAFVKRTLLQNETCKSIDSQRLAACLVAIGNTGCWPGHMHTFPTCSEESLCR